MSRKSPEGGVERRGRVTWRFALIAVVTTGTGCDAETPPTIRPKSVWNPGTKESVVNFYRQGEWLGQASIPPQSLKGVDALKGK